MVGWRPARGSCRAPWEGGGGARDEGEDVLRCNGAEWVRAYEQNSMVIFSNSQMDDIFHCDIFDVI